MKTIIFILALLLNLSCVTAQEVTIKKGTKIEEVKKGTYYKTDRALLNKYLGIWSTKINDKEFKFEILKKKTEVDGVFIDRLAGKYYFNNKSYYNEPSSIKCHAKSNTIEVLEKGTLRFRFFDYDNDKLGVLEFELIEENKASWHLLERGGYRDESFRKGFSVPIEMVLIRKK
ncbi:hypothetical protein ES731_15315 [Psychroflexus gondwanensis]|jgi:hypothetical protein|uniref:DUF6705 domain-containing protein n=1 Tax=Psychroflexus gondwanensis ACAM 44 TaxID=1189619 RepID=N1WT77_9FLAO|nr:DUF6705 family protein [Psychroflexus gondwanensis]EMY82225.1 hypothetical protein pgond44_03273 [Psychroflexus gondwanensis ACAM 44]TXE15513.1 hypothetical protein ES731_15315 [Psychroflexus gondwanensis]